MRKKGDALSKAWETINTPLIAADSAMKDQADEEQKERKSLLLAIKRNSRERQARHIAKGMPIKSAQSKENTMSRIRGQSKTHTTGSTAREKQATHAHISKLMDDLPKNKPSKGITVTKKTVSMTPVSKTTKVKKPVTLCGLKKKAETMNITPKQRIKLAQALLKQAAFDPDQRIGPTRRGGMGSLLSQLALILGGGALGGKMGGKGVANLVRKFGPKMPKGAPHPTRPLWALGPGPAPHPAKGALLPLAAGGVVGGGLAGGGAGYGLSEALKQGSDKQAKKRFMIKVAASNLSPREKLAAAGLIGRGLVAGAKALPRLMRGAGQAVSGAGKLAGKGLEAAGKGVQSAGKLRPSRRELLRTSGRVPGRAGFGTGGAIPESMRSPVIRNISQAAQGAGIAMQRGGRAVQAAPGVAGGAGLAGIAAGRMSKGEKEAVWAGATGRAVAARQAKIEKQKSTGGVAGLPLNRVGGGQDAYQGQSPYGTGSTRAGAPGLHSGLMSKGQPQQAGGGGPQDAYQGQSPYGTGSTRAGVPGPHSGTAVLNRPVLRR